MRSVIGLLLFGAIALGGCDKQSQAPQQADQPIAAARRAIDRSHRGEAAPAIAFTDPTGGKVTLADFRGQPVLLNLWATWCAPCVKEMPMLDALAGRLGDRVAVVTLSQDLKGMAAVGPFFRKQGYRHLKPWLDAEAAFSLRLGLNLPTTILYDSAGKELWRVAGDFDWSGDQAAALVAAAT